jgi:hypothetical protein
LILSNFSFDLLSSNLSKKPVASGVIVQVGQSTPKDSLLLIVKKGSVYEGEFIRTPEFSGTIKRINSNNQSLTWVSIETTSTNITTSSLFEVFSTVNITNTSLLVELTFIFLIFHVHFRNLKTWWNKLPVLALIASVSVWLVRNLLMDHLYTYSGFYYGGTTILVILLALIFFFQQLNKPDNPFIYAAPEFWIISAILIYKAGTFFLFLYGNTLDQSEKENFFIINSFFYIVENVLFAVAFLMRTKKLTHKKSDR